MPAYSLVRNRLSVHLFLIMIVSVVCVSPCTGVDFRQHTKLTIAISTEVRGHSQAQFLSEAGESKWCSSL